MRRIILLPLLLTLLASVPGAQTLPQHGDLVLSVGLTSGVQGFTAYMSPTGRSTLTTLVMSPFLSMDNFVRMAPNNTDLVVARFIWSTSPSSGELGVIQVKPGGPTLTTRAKFTTQTTDSFELDHDGQWIVTTRSHPATTTVQNSLLGVDDSTGAVTTFGTLATCIAFNEIVIDRDPGSRLPYTIVTGYPVSGSCSGPRILKADRQGTIVTIATGATNEQYFAVELHPRSGNYIATRQPGGALLRMTKSGSSTTLSAGIGGNAVKITQDDLAWVANGYAVGNPPTPPSGWVLKYCLSTNTVVTMMPTGLPQNHFFTGIDVYGSRTLVCNQPAANPRTVKVSVQSRHPGAPGLNYQLAASFARRPGIKFAGPGEWLDLDVTHPLFVISALNLAPGLFANFRGTLNVQGNAWAQVNIPSSLPSLHGTPVFVAGAIYEPKSGQVIQVTNTHWFLLP